MFRVLFVVILAVAAPVGISLDDDESAQLFREGKKAFRACAACHFTNEPTLVEDEDWLKLNFLTRCISGDDTTRVRKAIDVYLRSEKARRPLFVDENYKPREGRACGQLTVPATSGTAFLKAERESIRNGAPSKVRLYWRASEEGKTITVPAGKYRVIGYRFFRRTGGEKERLWTLSVSDINGCADIEVTSGKAAPFGFVPKVEGVLTAEAAEQGLSLAVRNERNSTLTLSRDGEMCLPRFVVEDKEGKTVFDSVFENT